MKENEQIYWYVVFAAYALGFGAFYNIMTFMEGLLGTMSVFMAALAVWALYDKQKRARKSAYSKS